MELNHLRTLGRSGLPVSPLALGTMTFGNKNWGSPDDVSRAIFDAYIDAGGNFIDTADVYAGGRSEELLGSFIAERNLRDKVVLATKWSFNGGNGRKNLHRCLESSLRRLGTEYVDLYWMHVWDGVTPPEELLHSLSDLVRSGKIRYYGLSDVPAWVATRIATLAETHGLPGPIALQMEYSLTERTFEQEHIPAARALGLALCPWSPLAAGFLTGKYTRDPEGKPSIGGGRLDLANQPFKKFTERNWIILDTLRAIAAATGHTPAQIALAWTLPRPAVASLIFGASKLPQLEETLASLAIELSPEHRDQLDQVSGPDPANPYSLFSGRLTRGIFGTSVAGWP